MTLSTRIYIQRPPDEPVETTNTMVLVSPKAHFVDIRINKDKYPYSGNDQFEEVFDWVMTGTEVPLGETKVLFKHEINLKEVVKSVKTGKPIEECKDEEDVGDFHPIEGSHDRKETGILTHPDTGKPNPYVEIWRSLDPDLHSPEKEVIEEPGKQSHGYVLEATLAGFKGKVVKLGNWLQAVIFGQINSVFPMAVSRKHYDGLWKSVIAYGGYDFPKEEGYSEGDRVASGGVEWRCIETF